jgi:hypothetical protein
MEYTAFGAIAALGDWVVAMANRQCRSSTGLDQKQQKLEHLHELPAIKALVEDIAQVRERIEERARRE